MLKAALLTDWLLLAVNRQQHMQLQLSVCCNAAVIPAENSLNLPFVFCCPESLPLLNYVVGDGEHFVKKSKQLRMPMESWHISQTR